MSLSSEIRANNKKKNNNNTKQIIKNQRLMNSVRLVLFLTLLIADIFYIIKENIIGISNFTHIVLIISIILEGLIFMGLLFLRFNTENKILKVASTTVYAIPLVAYIPMMAYGDSFSIVLFIIRLILFFGLLFLATRDNPLVRGSKFVLKQIGYIMMVAIIFVITFILLITTQTRRVVYSYDDASEGYVVKNVLKGYSDVEFKSGTVKISDYSLANAGEVITIPSSVVEVSENAFVGSDVKEIHLNSYNVSIIAALKNSNVEKIYIDEPNLVINDLKLASRRNTFRFYLSKDTVDEYREKNRRYDFLFVPICDEGEYYVAYNNSSLPIVYYKDGDLVQSPAVESTNLKRFKEWEYLFGQGTDNNPQFPITISKSLDLYAIWNNVYKISLDYHGGELVSPYSDIFEYRPDEIYVISDDGDIVLPTLEKDGYRFDGWYLDDDQIEDNTILASYITDMEVEARYSRIFRLKYHENGGIIPDDDKNQEYVDGDIIKPATPERLGYEFEGWFDNPELEGNKIERVTNLNTELYAKWKLSAPVVTVSGDINKIYDNNPVSISLNIDHPLISNENFSISYKWYKNDESKVISTKSTYNVIEAQNNRYYCHVTIKHLGNIYEVDSDYINVNIEKADYDLSSIEFDEFKLEFNGLQQIPSINTQIKGLDGIAVIVQYSYTGYFTNVDDMGTVTATFTTDSTNYNVPSPMTTNVEIIQKELELEYDSLSFIYDGNPHKPTFTLIGAVDGYPVELQYNNVITTDVGSYTILINISDNEHYNLNDVEVTYSIVKADFDLTSLVFDNKQFEYDGNSHIPNPTNLPSGLSLDIDNSVGAEKVSDTKAILRFTNTNSNYNTPSELEVSVTINPKQIDVTLDKTEFTYNGNVQVPSATLVGKVVGDNVSCVSSNNSVDFGTYTYEFELVGDDKDNYIVSNSSYNISYVIKKGTYDLSNLEYETIQFEYDGNSHVPVPTNLPSGLTVDMDKSVGATDVSDTKATLYFINTNDNYSKPSAKEVTVIIKPIKVKINVIESELTYQKKLLLPEVELVGIINSDNVSVNILNTNSIDVGEYTLSAELTGYDKSNYVIDEVSSNLDYSITKADFEIQYVFLDNTIVTYDGQLHHPSLDITNGKLKCYTAYQDEITIEYIDEYEKVGNYLSVVQFSVSGNSSNYVDPKTQAYNLTITKKEVSLEFDSLVFKYTGELIKPQVTNIIGKVDGDDLTISVANSDITVSGTYPLEFSYSGSDSGNYIVVEEYSVVVTESLLDIKDTGYVIQNYEGIYDGKEHTVTITGLGEGITAVFDKYIKDVCENVEVKITFVSTNQSIGITTVEKGYITIHPKPVTVEFDTTTTLVYNGKKQIPNATLTGVVEGDIVNIVIENESTNAGPYNATALLDNSNYYISNSADLSYTIEECHVTLVWEQLDLTYSKEVLAPTAIVKYNNELLDIKVNVTTGNNINVGSYTATAELEDSNYIIDGSNETTYNIIAKGLSISWSNKLLTYNGDSQAPIATVTPILGDNCNVTVEGANTVPGTYNATASLNNLNYKIEGLSTISYTIKKGVLTEEECNSVDYLTTVVYDGNYHGPNIDMVNKYTNDGSLIKYRYDGIKDAGQYYIDVEFYTDNGYYEPLIVSVALVINQLEVDIQLNETELRFVNDITRPTFVANNLVSSDDVTISITNNSSAIGDYVATFKINGTNKDNYKITNAYNYSIIKGIVDMSGVTFDNTSVVYNGNSQLPTSSNLPKGVEIDIVNSIGVINVSDTTATVKFILSSQTANNYEVPADMNVSMIVNKKELTVEWIETTFKYDGNSYRPTYALDGICNGDVVELIFDSVDGINRGEYTAEASSVTNDNYYIEASSCDYTITIGEYDMSNVVIQNKTFTYDGKVHNNAISVDQSELPAGVTVDKYEYPAEPRYAGEYIVTIKFIGDSLNYEPIPDMTAKVIINPKVIDVSWSDTSLTYNGYSQTPTATIVGTLYSGDICDVSVAGSQKNVGTYIATAMLSNSNYVASVENTEFTISPYVISVTVRSGSTTGPNFTYYYDGKVRNNITATYNDDDLFEEDELIITTNTSNIKASVGTYSYTLVFDNSNYTTTNITGTVTINKTSISAYNITWTQENTTELPKASYTLNGVSVALEDMPEITYVYLTYTNEWSASSYTVLEGEPTEAGKYAVTIISDNEDNISISDYNSIWSFKKFNYAPVQVKEIWSHDGQYNSNLITATGNPSSTKATFTIDDKSVTFTSGVKLETDKGEITFTITKDMTMTIYATNTASKPSIKINNDNYSITSGSGTVIQLSAGTYTIKKNSGTTTVYAIVLE